MRPADTSADAQDRQVELYRSLTPAARVVIAAAMSDDVREVARGGIRSRHPDYTSRDVELALGRLLYGDELFHRAWPHAPLLAP